MGHWCQKAWGMSQAIENPRKPLDKGQGPCVRRCNVNSVTDRDTSLIAKANPLKLDTSMEAEHGNR